MGLLQVISRIGAASAPWVAQFLRHVDERLPFILMGGLTVIAGFLCIKLDETKGKETAEVFSNLKVIEGMVTCILLFYGAESYDFVSFQHAEMTPKNGAVAVFLLCSQCYVFKQKRISVNWCSHLSSKTYLFDGFFCIGSINSVFKLFRFSYSNYRVEFLFSSFFI